MGGTDVFVFVEVFFFGHRGYLLALDQRPVATNG